MTEQLMEDLTNEEHEALLLMSEHGIAAPLSPATQAVVAAYRANWQDNYLKQDVGCLAAALRAAADQVVPDDVNPVGDAHDDARHDQWMRIRLKILAIAAELENTND
jgi:hypothetical protein